MKPKTALTVAAISAAPKLSRYEAIARSSSTVCTNSGQVSAVVLKMSAASGSRTRPLRKKTVKPSVRPKPGRTLGWRNQATSGLLCVLVASGVDDEDRARRRALQHGLEPVPRNRRRVGRPQHDH